jgi:hypothetical protein
MSATYRLQRDFQRTLCAALLALAAVGPSQAALFDRGGGMVYDSTLNITWLKDWNLPRTTGYSGAGVWAAGYMTWSAAVTWADNLTVGGYTDWRLPTMIDTGTPGCNQSFVGTDCGYNVQTASGSTVYSELAHLYHVTLGNISPCNPSTSTVNNCVAQTGAGPVRTGPFTNVVNAAYWTGLEYIQPANAWNFGMDGWQTFDAKNGPRNVVAVRNGDVLSAVPEAQTWALMALGLVAVAAVVKRRLDGGARR